MTAREFRWPVHLLQRSDNISIQADDLVTAYGAESLAEAFLRKYQANSPSEARYWEDVESEIERRTVQGSDVSADLSKFATKVFDYLDSASENRAKAHELALAIESLRSDLGQHPAVARAERCLSVLEARNKVLETIEAEVVAIANNFRSVRGVIRHGG